MELILIPLPEKLFEEQYEEEENDNAKKKQ